MKKIIPYTIVKSQIIGDSFDEATYEIWPHQEGGFRISAAPTRGGCRGSTTLVGLSNELRFPTVEKAKEWLESQPGFGKQDWFTKEID